MPCTEANTADLTGHMRRIAVLVTCHNRREKTLLCLRALFACRLPDWFSLLVVLVDDGSTDGTRDAVQAEFPTVDILIGDGNLFWNKGMHRAHLAALARQPEFFLWLNDDTTLLPKSLATVLETHAALTEEVKTPVIVVGSCVEDAGGRLTYGGAVSAGRLRRFTYRKVPIGDSPVECEVMNGNIVLVPSAAADRIGPIDPEFEHAMGDTDYALRARRAGCRVFVAPGVVGHCASNPPPSVDAHTRHSLREKWSAFTSRKRLPPRSWLRFTRRHGGMLWPLYFLQPYGTFLLRALRTTLMQGRRPA